MRSLCVLITPPPPPHIIPKISAVLPRFTGFSPLKKAFFYKFKHSFFTQKNIFTAKIMLETFLLCAGLGVARTAQNMADGSLYFSIAGTQFQKVFL
jgi:hypothetical protein